MGKTAFSSNHLIQKILRFRAITLYLHLYGKAA